MYIVVYIHIYVFIYVCMYIDTSGVEIEDVIEELARETERSDIFV
jgi:hypothetical protein